MIILHNRALNWSCICGQCYSLHSIWTAQCHDIHPQTVVSWWHMYTDCRSNILSFLVATTWWVSIKRNPTGRSLPRAWDTMISSGEVKNLFFYNVTAHKGPGFFALKTFAILSNLRNQWGLSEVRRLRLWLSFIIEHWTGHAYVDNVLLVAQHLDYSMSRHSPTNGSIMVAHVIPVLDRIS